MPQTYTTRQKRAAARPAEDVQPAAEAPAEAPAETPSDAPEEPEKKD